MEFRILGPLEVRTNGAPVALGESKLRTLVAVLLLDANRVVSTDRLLDALWGGSPADTAQTALHGLVSQLRRALGTERDRLSTRPPGYVLRVDRGELDAERFERLAAAGRAALDDGDHGAAAERFREALALWRGAALADFAYDDFAQAEIARLEDARLAVLEDKIEIDLALGRHVESTAELEALVSRHPLRERLRGQLMLALYRAGRQADALASYVDARRILASELGLAPSPQLQGLERAILRQDAALDLPERRGPEPQAPAGAADELRPVTALFADVVGSTALGERLPPEEVKALVGECVTAMSRAVEEHGGTVQAYMGDGICAYFGVPTAHEDDPERAARAALRIVEVVEDYSRDIAEAWDIGGFDVRVGINTGQTAVGTVGSARPQTVATGDSTNVAARLQATAEPGTIAVGDATVRRLTHRFRFETLGEVPVKGRSEPVRVARLVGTDDRAKPRPAPLVGRERELARLREVVDGLHAGRGQIALLTGEPGIGKSRLLAELRAIAGDDVVWLEGHTASYGGPPLAPFVDILRAWLGIGEGEAEIAARTKARAKLGSLLGERLGDVLPPLARLLRLRLPPELERPTQAGDDPDGAVVAYVSWLTALARDRPVVLALEDVHWADAATGGLAGELLALTEQMPLLLVLTLAGERGSEGWRLRLRVLDEYAHRAAELPVGPLSDEASAELLRTLLPGALDDATRAELVARAEGNPLYLAELLRALVEGGGVERRHRTWTLTSTAARLLPPALENVLVARIDRLPEGPRALAQAAAAIGRTFPVDVLRRVAGGDVDAALTALLRAGIVREVRRYPELECAFGHGLLQEAALSTLTAARRRELFGRVSAAWEQHFAGSLAEHSERLAHYYAQAGDERKARELLAGARPS